MKEQTVQQFLDTLEDKGAVPLAAMEDTLEQVVRTMVGHKRGRRLYVVDGKGVLQGVITLSQLKDAAFRCIPGALEEERGGIEECLHQMLATETAGSLMDEDVRVCGFQERLEDVLARMIKYNRTALPVLDDRGRVGAMLDITDLLRFWLPGEG